MKKIIFSIFITAVFLGLIIFLISMVVNGVNIMQLVSGKLGSSKEMVGAFRMGGAALGALIAVLLIGSNFSAMKKWRDKNK